MNCLRHRSNPAVIVHLPLCKRGIYLIKSPLTPLFQRGGLNAYIQPLIEGIAMQKCYEAIYDHGELEWLGVPPNFQKAQMIVVTGDDEELTEFHNTITALKLPDGVNVFSLLRAIDFQKINFLSSKKLH